MALAQMLRCTASLLCNIVWYFCLPKTDLFGYTLSSLLTNQPLFSEKSSFQNMNESTQHTLKILKSAKTFGPPDDFWTSEKSIFITKNDFNVEIYKIFPEKIFQELIYRFLFSASHIKMSTLKNLLPGKSRCVRCVSPTLTPRFKIHGVDRSR